MKILLIVLASILTVADVYYICKTSEKRILSGILSVASMLICALIALLRNINGMYTALLFIIVAIMNIIVDSDLKTQYISNLLLIVLNSVCLVAAFFVPNGNIFVSIIVAWAITGICFLIGKKSKGSIGTGDLFCMSGLMMSTSFTGLMNFIFMSLFSGTVYGLVSLILKKKTLKTEIPFAPFLLIGYLCMVFYI